MKASVAAPVLFRARGVPCRPTASFVRALNGQKASALRFAVTSETVRLELGLLGHRTRVFPILVVGADGPTHGGGGLLVCAGTHTGLPAVGLSAILHVTHRL